MLISDVKGKTSRINYQIEAEQHISTTRNECIRANDPAGQEHQMDSHCVVRREKLMKDFTDIIFT
jgi:hypothetical protein